MRSCGPTFKQSRRGCEGRQGLEERPCAWGFNSVVLLLFSVGGKIVALGKDFFFNDLKWEIGIRKKITFLFV